MKKEKSAIFKRNYEEKHVIICRKKKNAQTSHSLPFARKAKF